MVGLTASQLITDFGRTTRLIESARMNERSQSFSVDATREQVLLEVDGAYLSVLEAQAVAQVARKTVEARQVFPDRVSALAKGKLKSELDERFAQVALSEAQLLQLKAHNAVEAAFARLSWALGYKDARHDQLADLPVPGPPEGELEPTIRQAIADRPNWPD